jgi:hypothetical protein
MSNEELRIKYQALLIENSQLKQEIKSLMASVREQLPLQPPTTDSMPKDSNELVHKSESEENPVSLFPINKKSNDYQRYNFLF